MTKTRHLWQVEVLIIQEVNVTISNLLGFIFKMCFLLGKGCCYYDYVSPDAMVYYQGINV